MQLNISTVLKKYTRRSIQEYIFTTALLYKKIKLSKSNPKSKVQTSVLGLGVDFLFPLSQEQEQQQQEQPPTKYLSCYQPDFDQTLNIGFWEHLEQIPTVTVTSVQATFVLATFVHIRSISTVTDSIWTKF